MSRLIDEFDLTHDEIAKALGRSRASVTNFLRLLDLADGVKDAMIDGTIDMGHARALLPLERAAGRVGSQDRALRLVGAQGREDGQGVARGAAEAVPSANTAIDMQTRWLERQLARELGEKVSIRPGANDDYVLQLSFTDLAKLEASLQRLQDLVRQIPG